MARGLLLLLVGTAQLLLKAGSQRLLEYNATLGGAAVADELPCLIANTDEAADLDGLILSPAETTFVVLPGADARGSHGVRM